MYCECDEGFSGSQCEGENCRVTAESIDGSNGGEGGCLRPSRSNFFIFMQFLEKKLAKIIDFPSLGPPLA